jgi:signal transduction histidine kinase
MLQTALRRPLTLACWRETLYLLLGIVTGTVAFSVAITGFSVSIGLAILIIGLPIAAAAVWVDRWLCQLDRHRAALVLGRPIPSRYAEPAGATLLGRWLSVLRDAQPWCDGAWMIAAFPVTLAGFIAAVTAWSVAGALFTLPIYAWALPRSDWVGNHVLLASLLGPPAGAAAAVVAAWLVAGFAWAQAQMAAFLLGPRRAETLERRVETLADTRAGAVDAATTELQRVERDLHDGAQARLVALAMDLGLAEQRLAQADTESARSHVAAAQGRGRTWRCCVMV